VEESFSYDFSFWITNLLYFIFFELKKNTAFHAVLTLKRVCNKALAFWYNRR